MLKKILKYPIQFGLNTISVPENAKPLCAQMQHGQLVLWLETGGSPFYDIRPVFVVGTGHEFDPSCTAELSYVSTVQDGSFVWHVYA